MTTYTEVRDADGGLATQVAITPAGRGYASIDIADGRGWMIHEYISEPTRERLCELHQQLAHFAQRQAVVAWSAFGVGPIPIGIANAYVPLLVEILRRESIVASATLMQDAS